MSRGRLLVAAAVAAWVITSAALIVTHHPAAPPANADVNPATWVPAARQDLERRLVLNGDLGYGDRRTTRALIAGTVTSAPSSGTLLEAGTAPISVDGQPVILLDGAVPAWRSISWGATGSDVTQLQHNLRTLGYDPDLEITGTFSTATSVALRKLQKHLNIKATGQIDLGQVVFAPTPRILTNAAALGSILTPGASLLETTSNVRAVNIEADPGDAMTLQPGQEATVQLPDGSTAKAVVAAISKTVQSQPSQSDASTSNRTQSVVLRLTTQISRLDSTPVTATVTISRIPNALVVPVTALRARPGGGYVVDTRNGPISVDVTTYSDGLVALAGDQLTVGTEVQVAPDV